MDAARTPYKVQQCSKCPGDKEYYCESCSSSMCPECKENHVNDLKTIEHNVMTFHEKFNYISKDETCLRHPNIIYRRYCERCQVPACNDCQNHRKHKRINVRTAYKTQRQQHETTIHTVRSEALFYRQVLMTGIKANEKTCQKEFSINQSKMLKKAQKLKDLIDNVQDSFMSKVFCYFEIYHRCLKQNIEMRRHIAILQRYVQKYEQSSNSPIQFLLLVKTALPQIHPKLHTSHLSMTESLNKEDVVQLLTGIQITERGKRGMQNECLLKLMPSPEFHQSVTVTDVIHCSHISCVTPDKIWVSDREYTIMVTNTQGVSSHHMDDLYIYYDLFSYSEYYGLHTVTNEGELIYLDESRNISKLSKDMNITTTFKESTGSFWIPLSLHWCQLTGDLLVGMYRKNPQKSKVIRYNQRGQLVQTIKHDNRGRRLYNLPNYIAENINGDVVVSDFDYPCGAIVVTDRGGIYRFSYTGHPPESGLVPRGVCTDVLSHILVCDKETATVQMLTRDGKFLLHLLTAPSGIFTPCSLSYERSTHRLWVGSHNNNKLVVYRYIERQDAMTGLNPTNANVMESLKEIPTTEKETSQLGHRCLLKMLSRPEIVQYPTVEDIQCCYHIACVTQDMVWVSDKESNLILANSRGGTLHRVEDLRSHSYWGLGSHTVNIERELIYIDKHFNIKKLSKDMKISTTFTKRIDSTWEPRCVYSSQYTGDLLVAMYREKPAASKVIRYNQSGKLTQTIQHDNTGLNLYRKPSYITENTNGDVVVSDNDFLSAAVVVTDCNGRHRFSYTGHPQGSREKITKEDHDWCITRRYLLGPKLEPCGICTDALSDILVCDGRTFTVHMLNRDGQFLFYIRTRASGIVVCQSLSYDANSHYLWIGCRFTNKMCVYRYMDQHDVLTNERTGCSDGDVSVSRQLGYWQTTLPPPEEEEPVYLRKNSKGTNIAYIGKRK